MHTDLSLQRVLCPKYGGKRVCLRRASAALPQHQAPFFSPDHLFCQLSMAVGAVVAAALCTLDGAAVYPGGVHIARHKLLHA